MTHTAIVLATLLARRMTSGVAFDSTVTPARRHVLAARTRLRRLSSAQKR